MYFIKNFLIPLCMLKDYLDREIYNAIVKSFSFNDITEIRMRANENLIIVVKNKKFYLKDSQGEFIKANTNTIENFIKKASENSIYAFNDSIVNGYITLPKGIRVGLCGNIVTDDEKIVTIKEFQAINIRIPHFIKNCSLSAIDLIVNGEEIKNTLVISPPGAGKTTFIRDLIYQINQHNIPKNILIADERSEICSVVNGEPNVDLGGFCDIYSNCSKKFAFKNGIRSMRPDVIVTDEIDLERDLEYIIEAINSGVNIIATIHAKDLNQLKKKKNFDTILDEKFFSRFVVLSSDEGPGTILGVYDEKLNCIYCR